MKKEIDESVTEFFYKSSEIEVKGLTLLYIANMPRWVFLIPNDTFQEIVASYCVWKAKRHVNRLREVLNGKL